MPDKPQPDWAALWAPYDEDTYQQALIHLRPGDHVLDIGAGDLRFARRAAAHGCTVIAVEMRADVLARGLADGGIPPQIKAVHADARAWPFPPGIDAAVLLMRHCVDWALYVEKLRGAGCPLLITNARFGLGVEAVPLGQGEPWSAARVGWSACVRCGAVMFIAGDAAAAPPDVGEHVTHVEGCPRCGAGQEP
jgi:hypothetical protein